MRVVLSFTLLILFLLSPTETRAQFSFTALEGISAARKMAVDSLGANPALISISTIGEIDMQGFTLSFDLESGEAMIWVYAFQGEGQNELLSVAVIRLFAFQAFSGGQIPVPTAGEFVPLSTSGTYADSDAMIERLDRNRTYQKYRTDLPENLPDFVTFGRLLPDGIPFPDEIPLGQSVWIVSFSGEGDSALTCFVGADGGETFCVRRPEFLSVDDAAESGEKKMRLVGVNPVRRGENIRIALDGGSGDLAGAELVLYNSLGEEIYDLSETARQKGPGGTTLTIETTNIPAGTYHLLLRRPTVTERLALVVR